MAENTIQAIREVVDWQAVGLRVDRQAGLIRGVKILGLRSRNGRVYLPQALEEAVPLYESAKVNINHTPTPAPAPRDYRDRLGVVRQVVFRPEEGLFADLCFNPKHPLAEQLAWDAEHCPENVGLSHHVEARLSRRDGQNVVEAILRVHSVDVVADPATTQGLFESAHGPGFGGASADPGVVGGQTSGVHSPGLQGAGAPPADPQAQRIAQLEAELAQVRAAHAQAERWVLIRRLLAEHRLPEPESADPLARLAASQEFIQSLLSAPDEAAVRALVEDRARLVHRLLQEAASGRLSGPPVSPWGGFRGLPSSLGSERPVARDQLALGGAVRNVQEFVRAIT